MKKSLIWITAGAAVIGFGVPAFAAVQSSKTHPTITTVTPVAQPTSRIDDNGVDATVNSIDDNGVDATVTTVEDNPARGADDHGVDANDALDDHGVDANDALDDHGVDANDALDDNGVDATENTVEDISGPCDEAEHATDPRCTGAVATVTTVEDNPGRGANTGADDSGHHSGGDDSGHGGSDD